MATPLPTDPGDTLIAEGRLRIAANVRSLMGRGRTPTSTRKVTQTELCKVIGVGQSGMSERLSGKVAFDTDDLLQIARYFEVDVTDLLDEVRSRCFAGLSLVDDAGQMELAFSDAPTLVPV